MYLAGLSYLVTFGLILYLTFLGPAELRGFVVTFSGDAMVIQSVEADSQVGRGGLRAGDRVVLIDDRPVRIVRDWTEATGNLQAGVLDLWTLAVTAYEALTGALPFSSPAGADWRRAVLSGSFKPLSEHLDNPPEQWQTFFTRSLADDRTKRPKSAPDFIRQLEHAFG